MLSDNTLAGQITQTGFKIKVHWLREEMGDTGWRSGWYVATIHKHCEETDMLTTACMSEPKPQGGACTRDALAITVDIRVA